MAQLHINGVPNLDRNTEEQLADILTRSAASVNKCEPLIIPLVNQYQQATKDYERSHIEHQIETVLREALQSIYAPEKLAHAVKLLTDLALCDVRVDRAVQHDSSSIVLYCRVMSVEALLKLEEMIDSGRLSQLLSDMFSLVVTVSLSTEEYERLIALLTSAAGIRQLLTFKYKSKIN